MKKKEIATALGLSVALTMTGCATDTTNYENQINELSAQVTELQNELSDAQAESTDASQKNDELEKQVAELQEELTSLNEELTVDGEMIADADNFADNASINVTKYSEAGSTVYSKPEEKEENKIEELELNTEVFVVATFSDANNDNTWSAIATLVTVDESEKEMYQMISTIEKGTEKSKNKKIDFMLRSANAFTVEGKTIKADDLAENQEIRIVYARTSLLSNSKVTEQQHTSAEKSSTPKQSTPQQTAPTETVEGWGNCITPGCEGCQCIMFH